MRHGLYIFFLLLLLASSACLFSSRLLKNGCMRLPTFPLPHALILCVCVCLVLNATLLFCFGSMRSNSFECIIKNWNVAKTTPLNRRNTCCINGQRECGKKVACGQMPIRSFVLFSCMSRNHSIFDYWISSLQQHRHIVCGRNVHFSLVWRFARFIVDGGK